ncbi:rust resistance kinase Lr10-like [Camellia sinensis]|uniref:non-specific serine/threonine protein kinase n=1 Tax=Camellia sinensis var. sinensis TaxID=542762 RepID=A0A4S4EB93_CAMSN|nr:rust resistance kinase Lr10-like [Camellia sinensis]THG13004.1 hypothetical protein TEA_006985 [Camellia sinensis var. sinensis]
MDVPFILPIFLLSHLLLLLHSFSAQEDNKIRITCPKSFDCKPFHQPLSFPLSNSTYSQCGLCTVTCEPNQPPQIQLGNEGPWYDVVAIEENLSGNIFQIHDKFLQTQLEKKSCNVFKNLSFPNTSSISFTIYPYLTFFKCNKNFDPVSPKEDHFTDFHNYTNCEDYNLYYKYPDDDLLSFPAPLPPSCSVIQLPVNSSNTNPNVGDPFNLLTDTFSLVLHVSEDCLKCYQGGGQCQNDNQKFHCATNEVVSKRRKLILILGTAIVGIVIIVILLFCIIRKLAQNDQSTFFWKNKTESYQNVEAFLKNCGYLTPKRYTYSHIKKMTNSFRVKLGQGGYGCVFKGKLDNGCLVAVKVLKGLKGSGEEFINEVATISRTSHVNIVTLMGFCFEGRNRALIYEFMPNGSLEKFIHDGNSLTYHQLGWEALYQIAAGIARGLEYLHRGCNMRILHFDIKPHNILLDEDFCPKISDFGLAKLCPRKESIVSLLGARGTAGYIAPEVFCRNFGGVSHKSDVYSYGMMVLEMVGGRKNIDVEVDRTSEIYFPHWIYKRLELDEELGVHGIMNDEANESARKMIIVGLWCIQTDPLHRPSMSKVVEMLEGSMESLQVPPKPYLSSLPRSTPDSSTTFMP